MVMVVPVQGFDFQFAGPSLTFVNGSDSHRGGASSTTTCSSSRR